MAVTFEQLRELRAKRPFEPFVIVMNDGSRHEIRYPEITLVSHTWFLAGVLDEAEPYPTAKYLQYLHVPWIERIEMLPTHADAR